MLTIIAVFGRVGGFDFVRWDDDINVYANSYVSPLNSSNIACFWRAPYMQLYIPLSYTFYALIGFLAKADHFISSASAVPVSLNPHVFHCASIVLHIAATGVVFRILRLLTGKDYAALAGALLFGIHPLQVEAVAWISEMRGMWCSLFSLLALWAYLANAIAMRDGPKTPGSRKRYAVVALFYTCALLCKPTAVALPFVAWVLDYGVVRRPIWLTLRPLCAWLMLSLPWVLVTCKAQPVPAEILVPWWQRPAIAVDAIGFYLAKLLTPYGLAIDYGRSPSYVLHHTSWVYVALAALAFCLCWRSARTSDRLVAAAFGVFIGGLLPVLGLMPFVFQRFSTVADRYAYLPMLGAGLLIAGVLARYPRWKVVSFACIIALMPLSIIQTSYWQDSDRLFSRAVAINPRSTLSYGNIGTLLYDRGDTAGALQCYRKVLEIKPNDEKAHLNIALAYYRMRDYAKAVESFNTTLKINPTNAEAHNDLGVLHAQSGNIPAALAEWREAARLSPGYDEPRVNLARAGQPNL
ncbi:O-GlcNAc transferase [Capsulimonas corticalis]|uniref:O-GlcNAc transferase n=1 Tax=Capsulimonas corticalis TaxID=2219043 RepID=A0A402D4Z3_9BACT|nr:O-GlcNAc transferase [Capsulimonas corticalis]